MRDSNVSERLKLYMELYNINQSNILKKTEEIAKEKKINVKIRKNDLSQYVSGKVEPGSRKLALLSLALDINEAWLLGYDVPMERINSKTNDKLINKIMTLSEEQKKAIINIIDNMK